VLIAVRAVALGSRLHLSGVVRPRTLVRLDAALLSKLASSGSGPPGASIGLRVVASRLGGRRHTALLSHLCSGGTKVLIAVRAVALGSRLHLSGVVRPRTLVRLDAALLSKLASRGCTSLLAQLRRS